MDRHLKWILLASLLINAAGVGFIVANIGRGPMMPFNHRLPPPMMGQRPDDDTRAVLRAVFEAERPALDKALKDTADARYESEQILATDPLDPARLDAAMARLRASSSAAQESFHRAVREAAGKLNAPQRAALGRLLERAPSGRLNGSGRGRAGGPVSNAIVDIINGPNGGPPPGEPGRMRPPPQMGLGAPPPRD